MEKNELINKKLEDMVKYQIVARGINDEMLVKAFLNVDRADFVTEGYKHMSYNDYPLYIGRGQTISQPYMVAFMTQFLELTQGDRVLEIGTGSGYQTAILAELAGDVYTIERIEELGCRAKEVLDGLKYENIHFKVGDGYEGWTEFQPFDKIILTAAPLGVPEKLMEQLKIGGKMLIPIGKHYQTQLLYRLTRTENGFNQENLGFVCFVPMLGEVE